MGYLKKFLFIFFLLIFIILLSLKFTVFSSRLKINIYKSDIDIHASKISIFGDMVSHSDSVYKVTYYLSRNKKSLYKLLPEKVFMLKKFQRTSFEESLFFDKDFFSFGKKFYLAIYIEEVLPKKVLIVKRYIDLQIPKLKIDKNDSGNFTKTVVEKSVLPATEEKSFYTKSNLKIEDNKKETEKSKMVLKISDKIEKKSDDNQVVKKDNNKLEDEKNNIGVRKILIEKNFYQIKISTENFLPEYFYGEIIETGVELNNLSNILWKPQISMLLRNNYGIVITSNIFNLTLQPKENLETKLHLKVLDFMTSGEYEIEYFYELNNKKYSVLSPKFKISDKSPKIMITDLPKIRFKTTNTILVEVSDDRGISSVSFIEIEPKTLKEKSFPMTLIAGDKKFGLYSYTTEVITKKGLYKFYIKAEDISGNTTTTEIYELQIVK